MVSAAATPSQVRLRTLLSRILSQRGMHPLTEPRARSRRVYSSRNSQVRKSAGVVLEGEGRQRRRVIRMEGAYLLPTVRRSQSINGLLYARERDASEWTDSGMEAVERGDSNGRRDEEEIDSNGSCMDAGQEGMKIGRERAWGPLVLVQACHCWIW